MIKQVQGVGRGRLRSWAMTGALLALALLADAASAECLTKPVARPDGTTGKQSILAPRSEIPKYAALGYRVEQCTAGVEQLRQSIAVMCTSQILQSPVLRAGDARRGVSFGELCASARAAVAEMEREAAGGQ
jgi:hypothetical protein